MNAIRIKKSNALSVRAKDNNGSACSETVRRAVEAAHLGYGLAIFLLVSLPARLIRFVLVTSIAGAVSWTLRRRVSLRAVRSIHVAFWIVFYAWFFTVMADS
jgi:hypothetical protein